jgi:serine/threonine protein kinase
MKLSNLVGQALDGKYLIEKQLGKGGMGAVFLATHLGTERPVAVKVIMPQYMQHDEFVERFRREARAAGRLRHPNVVDVTDFGFADVDQDRVAYLVMEYLDGCALDEVLEEERKLPFGLTLDILEQVCSAVDEAHQQGIIHRDLKPDNIWLEPNRRGGYTIKVLDFGIAKLEEVSVEENTQTLTNNLFDSQNRNKSLTMGGEDEAGTLLFTSKASSVSAYQSSEITESSTQIQDAPLITKVDEQLTEAQTREMKSVVVEEEDGTKLFDSRPTNDRQNQQTSSLSALTRVGSVLGTPLYMSPEQCKGKALDPRSDVYSLAVIAYQMLSGDTPFRGEYQSVMKAHVDEQPPMLKVKGVRKKILKVVMSSLAKNPDERPSSAAAFAGILRANSEGVGILFQRALTLFSRYLPSFMKLSLIVFAPLIVITVLQVTNNVLVTNDAIPKIIGAIVGAIFALFSAITGFLTSSILTAITAWIVTSISAAPLRPVEIKPAFVALRRRIKPFLWTSFLVSMALGFIIAVGVVLCAILAALKLGGKASIALTVFVLLTMIASMALLMSRYALATPVTLLEGLSGRASLRRSVELTKRSRRTVLATIFIQFVVPPLLAAITVFIISAVVKAFDPKEKTPATTQQTTPQDANTNASAANLQDTGKPDEDKDVKFGVGVHISKKENKISKREGLVNNIFQIVWLPANVVLGMFAAVVTGLLYLKTRQAGGESIKDVQEHSCDDRPRAKWQQKMRERLSLQTRTGGRAG